MILFPLVIMLVLQLGLSEVAEVRNFIKPFTIVVRDLDQTTMSNTLIEQLDTVEIFDEVIVVHQYDNNDYFSYGAAGIITIPKDFFYDMFVMEGVVEMELNSRMPFESELCRSMLQPILDIARETQKGYAAEYALRYGDASSMIDNKQWLDAISKDIINDVFLLIDKVNEKGYVDDISHQTHAMLSSCVFFLLCFLIPLYTLKTLPEELRLGMSDRYRVAGGTQSAALASKFVSAACIFIVIAILFSVVLFATEWFYALVASFILFIACFSLMVPFALLLRDSVKFTILANTYLVVSILLSGCVYPIQLYPSWAQQLARLFLPYHIQGAFLNLSTTLNGTFLLTALLVCMTGAIGSIIIFLGRRGKYAKH